MLHRNHLSHYYLIYLPIFISKHSFFWWAVCDSHPKAEQSLWLMCCVRVLRSAFTACTMCSCKWKCRRVSAEGFAFSINCCNPQTRNEPEESSSALLCICSWPRSDSKDPELISQFCTCTPAISFQCLHQEICRHLRVGFRSEINIDFYQLGEGKCSVIITLTKPQFSAYQELNPNLHFVSEHVTL